VIEEVALSVTEWVSVFQVRVLLGYLAVTFAVFWITGRSDSLEV
jgi:hypothetical protein